VREVLLKTRLITFMGGDSLMEVFYFKAVIWEGCVIRIEIE